MKLEEYRKPQLVTATNIRGAIPAALLAAAGAVGAVGLAKAAGFAAGFASGSSDITAHRASLVLQD